LIGGAAAGAVAAAGTVAAAAAETPAKKKIVGLACSLRPGKSTLESLRACLEAARAVDPERIEIELVDLAAMKIPAGPAAGLELEPGERDDFPALVPKLADPAVAAIVVATPVYFGNMSSLCKAFLERWMTFRKNGFQLSNKVGAVVAVGGTRNGGQELAIRSVQTCLMSQDMIVVGEAQPLSHGGAAVWNSGDNFLADETNQATLKSVGKRVAQVALR
jgi:multimeric flavodoxin WrbA